MTTLAAVVFWGGLAAGVVARVCRAWRAGRRHQLARCRAILARRRGRDAGLPLAEEI